jgi:hemolysin D
VAVLAYDGWAAYATASASGSRSYVLTSVESVWSRVHVDSLVRAETALAGEGGLHARRISAFRQLLEAPAALVLMGLGTLIALLGLLPAPRRRTLPDRAAAPAASPATTPAQPGAPLPSATPSVQSAAAIAQRLEASDREFLPAALEILETPPSPVKVAMIWFICVTFASVLAWAYLGWLDIHAVARGRIQPSGKSKVVQPLDAGKVAVIHVENGAKVKAGDPLVDLDSTETGAEREALTREFQATSAEIARRRTAVAAAEAGNIEIPPAIQFSGSADAALRQRETAVLAADLGQLASMMATLRAQIDERKAQDQRLRMSIKQREKTVELMKERVDMREEVKQKGAGSRMHVIEVMQDYQREVTALETERGQLIEIGAGMRSLERRLAQAKTEFVADQTTKLAEAERRRDRLAQELVKAETKNERTRLLAPIAGTVQQLAVTTVGQVVASGQSLMTIVPSHGPIEIEAMIANQDIGFVEEGQAAAVKIDAFPFTRYGTIDATVVKVSRDAVEEREATGLTDPTAATRQRGAGAGGSGGGQGLVFPATVSLAKASINVDGKDIPLSAGMAVTVEIKTGKRRALDYVLSPLREVKSVAGTER